MYLKNGQNKAGHKFARNFVKFEFFQVAINDQKWRDDGKPKQMTWRPRARIPNRIENPENVSRISTGINSKPASSLGSLLQPKTNQRRH